MKVVLVDGKPMGVIRLQPNPIKQDLAKLGTRVRKGAAKGFNYISKHPKQTGTAILVVGGIALAGIVIYGIYSFIQQSLDPNNTPLCNGLKSQMNSLLGQIATINGQIGASTPTTAQNNALASLNAQLYGGTFGGTNYPGVIPQLAANCSIPTPGQTADTFFKQIAAYASLGVGIAAIGISSAATFAVARRAYGWSKSKGTNSLPDSVEDTEVSPSFSYADMSSGFRAWTVAEQLTMGQINLSEADAALTNLAAEDGVQSVAAQISEYYQALYQAEQDIAIADIYAGVSADMAALSAADDALAADATDILDAAFG